MSLTQWLLLAALALVGLQSCRLADERADHAETRAARAQEREQAATSLAAEQDNRRKSEADLTARILEDAHETQNRLDQNERDLAASRGVAQRLRVELAALAARSCSTTATSPTPNPGGATTAASDLLAELQRRLDDATDAIAGFADRAAEAGAACERAYGRAREAMTARKD